MPIEKSASLNLTLCRECGGRCCQASPGIWVDPERFFAIFFSGQRLTLQQLREWLPEIGLVLWEQTGVPIPAPRSLDAGCAFLRADGCQFSIGERPCQCLALVPVKETLKYSEGSLCRLPEEFSRKLAGQRWQHYWQTV